MHYFPFDWQKTSWSKGCCCPCLEDNMSKHWLILPHSPMMNGHDGTCYLVWMLFTTFHYSSSNLYSSPYFRQYLSLNNFSILSATEAIQISNYSACSAIDGKLLTFSKYFILFEIFSFLNSFFNMEVNGRSLQILFYLHLAPNATPSTYFQLDTSFQLSNDHKTFSYSIPIPISDIFYTFWDI